MKQAWLEKGGGISETGMLPLYMKRMRRIFLAALSGFFSFPLIAPTSVNAADVTVNVGVKNQVIDGFGASSAWCGTISSAVMKSLYGDLGFSILRLRIEEGIGDTWQSGPYSSWAPELANAKSAISHGAVVFASPWNPPPGLRTAGTGGNQYAVDTAKWSGYRDYLNAYVKYFKDNGVNLYAISIQNEPDFAHTWTGWSAAQIHDFIVRYGATITTKLISGESYIYNKSYYDGILNDPKALDNVAIFGTHIYGTTVNNYAYPLFQQIGTPAGKKIWMTEHFLNSDDDMTTTVMPVAKEIHDCLVTGKMNAFVYWWITYGNGLATGSGTIYKRAYVIGQFSKYVRPGYFRVDATDAPATGVSVSAYSGADTVVIVAINTGTSAASQKFTLQNATVSQFASWSTTATANMAAGAAATVSGGSFTADLPAQSITTFVGKNTTPAQNVRSAAFTKASDFKTILTGGKILVSPATGESYDVRVHVLNGSRITTQRGIRGVFAVPASAKGMYVLDLDKNGRKQRVFIPVY